MRTTQDIRSPIAVTDNPMRSGTLPGWAYTDPDFFAREKEAVHFRSWHYAGCTDELRETGDYVTASILDESIIVIRDKNGELGGLLHRTRAHLRNPIFFAASAGRRLERAPLKCVVAHGKS